MKERKWSTMSPQQKGKWNAKFKRYKSAKLVAPFSARELIICESQFRMENHLIP